MLWQKKIVFGLCIQLLFTGLIAHKTNGSDLIETEIESAWVTGESLMPSWGFYPNRESYGGAVSLGAFSAWQPNVNIKRQLTWVADFPVTAKYNFWIRKYGTYGSVETLIDENLVTGGRLCKRESKYIWVHQGVKKVSAGKHHIDLLVSRGMLDAVLFTRDETFNPAKDKLPRRVNVPTLRSPRKYRDDSYLKKRAGIHGYVVASTPFYCGFVNDVVPKEEEILDCLKLWGAANQYINGTFLIRAIEETGELKMFLSELIGPNDTKLDKDKIDIRVVGVHRRQITLFEAEHPAVLVPELLLRDDRTGMPPKGRQGGFGGGSCVTSIGSHESRRFWLTVHIPTNFSPGVYRGNLLVSVSGSAKRDYSLPVEVEILPIDLQEAEGYYSIFYPSQPDNPELNNYVKPSRYFAEIQDQIRHGLNSTSLYGRIATISFAKEAGMTKPPCIMRWPDKSVLKWIDEAQRSELNGLIFYGVDEPRSDSEIERCKKEVLRRNKLGIGMMAAINSRKAQLATRDIIDNPIYNLYVFSGKDNDAVMYARKKGFKPISYWKTSTTFPLSYRALTGLYNKACGYLGSMPWSYQDISDNSIYDPDKLIHKVSYPDEYGNPIPTLSWEAHRAGIDDTRYLEALDLAIAVGEKKLKIAGASKQLKVAIDEGKRVRSQYFESIKEKYFLYLCSLEPGNLENARRSFANALVSINAQLN